ncbi:MAG: glycosyltransferase [Betaproteobacteria bacterium]
MPFPLRQRLIINHTGFHPPLRRALEDIGLVLDEALWLPNKEQLESAIACYVWFYDCIRYPLRIWRLKRLLKRHGVPLVTWNRDAPHYLNRKPWRLDWLDRSRMLDIYASHSLIDTRQFSDQAIYLANAADTNTYHLNGVEHEVLARLRHPENYRHDVSFFGGMDGKRYKEDADREHFFGELGMRLQARGISFLFCEAEGMSVAEQTALIQASRINLNYGARCEYQAPVASGLPERCFGIPACGGFLLCDKRTHARDDFTIGENWAEFDGIDDCVAKIEYWLAHFDDARDLAERCYHHVMANHTYRNRATKFHQAMRTWHAENSGGML